MVVTRQRMGEEAGLQDGYSNVAIEMVALSSLQVENTNDLASRAGKDHDRCLLYRKGSDSR